MDGKFGVILGYMMRSCLKNLKMHYGYENANNIESGKKKKALKGLMGDQSQWTETRGKLQSEDTGHTKNEQQHSEEQGARWTDSAIAPSATADPRHMPQGSGCSHPTSAGLATASQTNQP